MARTLRPRVATQWPLLLVVVGAVVLVKVASSSHLSKPMALGVAAAVPALVVLVRLSRGTALQVCIVGAAFFSGAPVKFGQTNVSDVFIVLIVGILVLKRSDGPLQPLPRGLLVGLALIVGGGLLGSLFKPSIPPFSEANGIFTPTSLFHLSLGMSEAVRFTYGTIAIILIVRMCRFSRTQTRRALVAFGLGASFSVIWGLFQDPGYLGRASGLTAHPVALGWISAFAAIVGLGLLLTRSKVARRVGALTILFGVLGVAQSGTRSAVVLLLAGFVITQLGFRSMRRTSQFVLLGVLAVAIGLTGIAGDSPVGARLQGRQYAQTSDIGRQVIQRESVALVRDHGITGIGLPYLYPPHNLILGILGSAGIIGLTGLLVVVIALARRLMETPQDAMSIGVLAAALSVYVCSWVVNVGWGEWFWLPIALALAAPAPPPGGDASDVLPTSESTAG